MARTPQPHAKPATGHPVFAQPHPTQDPGSYRVPHPSDASAYRTLDELQREGKLQPIPFPAPRGGEEPRLTLEEVFGDQGKAVAAEIAKAGRLVFHAVGDTGNIRSGEHQGEVADKMVADFDEPDAASIPRFFFHLGDVIYNFGEAAYYYDQFYDAYRNYPAPILALAGNHDGLPAPGTDTPTLQAFLNNFCTETFETAPDAGGLARTTQVQPGVYFTFEAPLLRIIALYSNALEDPGYIAGETIGDAQLAFLKAALKRGKDFKGALIIAHHHPAFTAGSQHGWSVEMLAQIDQACEETGVWPHAVLSAHAHNTQRFTRYRGKMQIPYVVAGAGGHNVTRLRRVGDQPATTRGHRAPVGDNRYSPPFRVPYVIQQASAKHDKVVLERYDDTDYGYLRVIVTEEQLRIEYHPASDGSEAKTPDDSVTVDLATRRIVHHEA